MSWPNLPGELPRASASQQAPLVSGRTATMEWLACMHHTAKPSETTLWHSGLHFTLLVIRLNIFRKSVTTLCLIISACVGIYSSQHTGRQSAARGVNVSLRIKDQLINTKTVCV